MKAIISFLTLMFLLGSLQGQEESAKQLLRDGLFEEEANADLAKAEAAYRKLIEQFDEERRYAGTALFRMAEIARKRGEKELAARFYQRVVREFSDQEEIAGRAGTALAQLGVVAPRLEDTGVAGGPVADEEAGELQRLRALKEESADLLDGLDESGTYPLHRAAAKGWANAIAYLLKEGVTVDARTSATGMTPLDVAIIHGRIEAVKKLLEAGANHSGSFHCKATDLPVPPPSGLKNAEGHWTPLHLAIGYNRKEVAKVLLEARASMSGHGLNLKVGGFKLVTPLMLAMAVHSKQMVELLLEKGCDVNQVVPYSNRSTALLVAVDSWQEFVPRLLAAGADPNLGGGENYTALGRSVSQKDIVLMKSLLKAGADPNALNGEDVRQTPLRQTMTAPDGVEKAKLLIEAGARPNIWTCVAATEENRIEFLKLFMEADNAGENVKKRLNGVSPLLHFIKSVEAAKLLVAAGAQVNAVDPDSERTALDMIVQWEDTPEHRALFDYLLDQGAKGIQPLVETPGASGGPRPRSGGGVNSMLPYAWEKLVYSQRMSPNAVRMALPHKRSIVDGEVRATEGTPAPSIPELLGGGDQWLPRGGSVVKLRVFRMEDSGIRKVSVLTQDQIESGELPDLQWGDLVELSVVRGDRGWLSKVPYDYAPRTVTFKFGEMESQVRIEPDETWWDTRARQSIFLDAQVPMTTSPIFDLRKVLLHRGEEKPVALNFPAMGESPRLRLIDGDVIEIPLLREEGRIVAIHPDSVKGSQIVRTTSFLEFLRTASYWRGGRDLSQIEIVHADGAGEWLDWEAKMAEIPQNEWTSEKLRKLDVVLQAGDLIVLHPKKEVSWKVRSGKMPLDGTKLRHFVEVLGRSLPRAAPTPPKPAVPARQPVRSGTRRVPTPPSR